jgi:hypothetical protein
VHLRRFAAASALLVSTASLTAAVAAPAGASATSAAFLYVQNTSDTCTDSGSGTAAAPFCTIQAAANVVAPGQTVLIVNSFESYSQGVTVTTSGTPSAPITFAAASGQYYVYPGQVPAFTLNGVSNIVISGLDGNGVLISGSSDITLENSRVDPPATGPAVHITGASSNVDVVRDRISSAFGDPSADGVLVDGGSTGTVIATDYVHGTLAVDAASGTEVAGNTVLGAGSCLGVLITGGSASTSVENTVVSGLGSEGATCSSPGAEDLLVSADSAATTTAKYNVLSTDDGATVPYSWSGTTYTDQSTFQSSTGQGGQDSLPQTVDDTTNAVPTDSPLIDSADADAPGETTTDVYGNPRADDAGVANTGTGSGYYDRGALEYQEYTSSSMVMVPVKAQGAYAEVDLKGVPWGTSVTETFDWGDGTPKDTGTSDPSNFDLSTDFGNYFAGEHLYAKQGTFTVTETLTDAAGTTTLTGTITTTGSTYQAVAPTRVLDTRYGTGTGGVKTPVPANGNIAFSVTGGVAGAPAASSITAVVLNVTVTAPTAGGHITAYPDGTTLPNSSNLNFSKGETVPNLVTVKVGADGKVVLNNASPGTAHLVADVEGYYVGSMAGGGYTWVTPKRLLDTRTGTGVGGSAKPVAANGTVRLKVASLGSVPASGVTAVVLNVTVTAPTGGGYVTVYPGGSALPNASNLNFSAGETVPNLVTVPLGADGTVSLTNRSGGTTHLIADVFGYYKVGSGHVFAPVDPTRVLDTRTGAGQESQAHRVAANSNQPLFAEGGSFITGEAFVLNVTVVGPQAGGNIAAYQDGTTLPTTSNLNFAAGETVPNMVICPEPVTFHNYSNGTLDLVADEAGYFS